MSIDCKKMFIFAMLAKRNTLTQESILFKSKTEIRQNFKQRTEAINAHSVLYMLQYGLGCRIYTYQNGRGNIVSSMFILLRRLAMPLFYGRKAQVSRLSCFYTIY